MFHARAKGSTKKNISMIIKYSNFGIGRLELKSQTQCSPDM